MFKQNSSQYSAGLIITNVKNIYDNINGQKVKLKVYLGNLLTVYK